MNSDDGAATDFGDRYPSADGQHLPETPQLSDRIGAVPSIWILEMAALAERYDDLRHLV